MTNYLPRYVTLSEFIFTLLAVISCILVPGMASANTGTSTTASFSISKVLNTESFVGDIFDYQFSFHIVGNGIDVVIPHGSTTELLPGDYSITEIGPANFDPKKWTVLWQGDICSSPEKNMSAFDPAPLKVLTKDYQRYTAANPGRCSAINQYKPGTLQVHKVIVGTTTVPYETFGFTINGGDPIMFNSDSNKDVDVPKGSFDIVEVSAPDYTTTYNGCSGTIANNEKIQCAITNTLTSSIPTPVPGCTDPVAENYNSAATEDDGSCTYPNASSTNGTLVVVKNVINDNSGTSTPDEFSFQVNGDSAMAFNASGTNVLNVATGTYSVVEVAASGYTTTYSNCTNVSVSAGATTTCTITNDDTDGGGGSSSDPDTYRITGYVWHDNNENTQWDGFGVAQEEASTTVEEELPTWTVQITNGSETYSTTTDTTGFYYFDVPAGTWTITEVLKDGWALITPISGSHLVTVPEEFTQSLGERLFAWMIPTAHAAVIATYGPFNFGNNESSSNNGGCSNCGGGGPTDDDSPDSGVHSRGNTDGASNDDPTPQVLGEQVSFVPQGAPDTGAGGAAVPISMTLPISAAVWFRRETK